MTTMKKKPCQTDYIWTPELYHSNIDGLSCFDKALRNSWSNAKLKKVMNYEIENLETKVLPGPYQIVAELNPQRLQKRRTPETILSIKQAFDSSRFNFTMINQEEILFQVVGTKHALHYYCKEKDEIEGGATQPATVIVNAAPLTLYHNLILPSCQDCFPQVLNCEALLCGISCVLGSNTPAMKVGFNSLGGMASVNHLHLHVYYLHHPIHAEIAECENRVGPLYIFKNHFAPGFVFQLRNRDVKSLARNCMILIDHLLEAEICHNVMMTRGRSCDTLEAQEAEQTYDTVRVCVWVRKPSYGIKNVKGYAVALCELAGHLPVYDEETWESVTEDQFVKDMRDACLETFSSLLPRVEKLFS